MTKAGNALDGALELDDQNRTRVAETLAPETATERLA
jgi:hypothetical protein